MKFEIILPLLCFLFDPLTKALQDMEFYDKLVDRFQDPSKVKNRAAVRSRCNNNYLKLSKENVLRNIMLSH